MKQIIGGLYVLLLIALVVTAFSSGYKHRQMTWIEDCDAIGVTIILGTPYRCAPYLKKKVVTKKKISIYKHKGEFSL